MKEQAFIALRCPSCLAQVNVATHYRTAKCRMCGLTWEWRAKGIRVALAPSPGGMQFAEVRERRSRRRYNPDALEVN